MLSNDFDFKTEEMCKIKLILSRAVLIKRNIMQVPNVILIFLIAKLRNKKIQVKLILAMLYVSQYIQNITISTCNQCTNSIYIYIYIFEGDLVDE